MGLNKDEQFHKGVERLLVKIAEKTDTLKWKVQTLFGPMTITLWPPEPRQKLFSVFCRFEEPKRVPQYLNANPYSGKCNILLGSPKQALNSLKSFLTLILPK